MTTTPEDAGEDGGGQGGRSGGDPPSSEPWAPDTLSAVASVRERFVYTLPEPPDLRGAQAFRPGGSVLSGAAANAVITDTYAAFDRAFAGYLGDPPIACWVTFAKFASNQVGRWIRLLEEAWNMSHAAGQGAIRSGLAVGRRLGAGLVEARFRVGPLAAARAALDSVLAGGPDPLGQAVVMRNALVEANTDMFARIGAPFHAFLAAEARGADGRVAVADRLRSQGLDDPSGHLRRSFALYRKARALGARARSSPCAGRERAVLLAVRRHLVHEANFLLVLSEQAMIQRPTVFDHPLVHAACRRVRPGELSLSLPGAEPGAPSERFPMLPQGGSWSDFATRVGLQPVSGEGVEGALAVHLPGQAEPRMFLPDPRREGTILDLYCRYLDGPAGARLLRSTPRHP